MLTEIVLCFSCNCTIVVCFSCNSTIDPPLHECTDISAEITELCSHVIDTVTSVFSGCFSKANIDPEPFQNACWYDVCYSRDDDAAMRDAACGTYASLAEECASKGVIVDWRQDTNCGQLLQMVTF